MPSHKDTEIGYPTVFYYQVGYENAEQPVFNARRNSSRLSDIGEENNKPNRCYVINETVPHGEEYIREQKEKEPF